MTTLSSFNPEEAELIVSLPYRIGINVSYSEDEGGEMDDKLERQAMEKVLHGVVRKEGSGELVKDVAKAVLSSKGKWDVWSQGVFNIEPLCEKTAAVLRGGAETGEIREYIKMCLDVANGVAQAYGEFGGEDFGVADSGAGVGFIRKIKGLFLAGKGREADHPMNISAAEDSSIERISTALKKALEG